MPGEWVLLNYRLPREPSAPRVALWRRLKRLGVAKVSDGLVALPADARTREHLEWAAQEVVDNGGAAGVWLARPSARAQEHELAAAMSRERAAEYAQIEAAALEALEGDPGEWRRALGRLRRLEREVARRDFFPPLERESAVAAIRALAHRVTVSGERAGEAVSGRSR